jgi:hypothetical protein
VTESWREMAEGNFHSLEALTGERDVQPSTKHWSAPATHLFRGTPPSVDLRMVASGHGDVLEKQGEAWAEAKTQYYPRVVTYDH